MNQKVLSILKSSRGDYGAFGIIIFLGVIVGWPIFQSPLGADDIWFSTLPSRIQFGVESLVGHYTNQIHFWQQRGRLLLLSQIYEEFSSYLVEHRLLYKFYLLILNIIIALLIYTLLKKFHLSSFITASSSILYLALGEYRDFFDPRLHFGGVILFSDICLLVTMKMFIDIGLDSKVNRIKIYGSILMLMVCCNIYEVSFVALLPFLIFSLINLRRLKNGKSQFTFLFLSYVVLLSVLLFVRARAKIVLDGYAINLSRELVIHTFSNQFLGVFPATKFHNTGFIKITYSIAEISILAMILAALFLGRFLSLSKVNATTKSTKSPSTFLMASGLWMWLFCSALISVTLRWQNETSPGLPYISVLTEQIGFAIFVAGVLKWAEKWNLYKYFSILVMASIGFLMLTTIGANYSLFANTSPFLNSAMVGSQSFGWDRQILEDFMTNLPQKNAVEYFYPQRSWTSTTYLEKLTRGKISAGNSPDWWVNSDNIVKVNSQENQKSLIIYRGFDYSTGVIAQAPLNVTRAVSPNGYYTYSITSGVIFIKHKRPFSLVRSTVLASKSIATQESSRISLASIGIISQESISDWTVLRFNSARPIFPLSLLIAN